MIRGHAVDTRHVSTGFLGSRQEARPEEALPVRQLAHFVHQVSHWICMLSCDVCNR